MDRSALAVDLQSERFLLSQQFVSHIVEGLRSENGRHGRFNLFLANLHGQVLPHLFHQVAALSLVHARDLYTVDPDFFPGQVDGSGFLPGRLEARAEQEFHHRQVFRLGLGGQVTAPDEAVDGFLVETHHVVPGNVRPDRHLGFQDVLFVGITSQHVDTGRNDIRQVVDFAVIIRAGAQIDADNQVCPQLTGQVGRVIVPHATIDQDHSVRPDRSEQARDGHGGTHGRIDLAGIPDFRRAGHQVRSHAGERNREFRETAVILVADGQRTDHVADVLAENHARRQAADQVVLEQAGRRLSGGCAQMDVFITAYGIGIALVLFPEFLVNFR